MTSHAKPEANGQLVKLAIVLIDEVVSTMAWFRQLLPVCASIWHSPPGVTEQPHLCKPTALRERAYRTSDDGLGRQHERGLQSPPVPTSVSGFNYFRYLSLDL